MSPTSLHRALQVLLLTTLIVSCDAPSTIQTSTCVQGESSDQTQIISAIEKELTALTDGLEKQDAHLLFSIFSTSAKANYVRDGSVYREVSEAEEEYAKTFKRVAGGALFEFTEKHFDILSANSVLFTGVGVITPAKKNEEPWTSAYTIFWVLEPAGWKALNMHISWKDRKNQ